MSLCETHSQRHIDVAGSCYKVWKLCQEAHVMHKIWEIVPYSSGYFNTHAIEDGYSAPVTFIASTAFLEELFFINFHEELMDGVPMFFR